MTTIRKTPLALLALIFLAPACVLNGGGIGDGDDGPVVGGPDEGSWFYDEGDIVDGCNFIDDVSNGGGNFGVTESSSSGFHVIPNDGTEEFDCSLDGNEFTCDERLVDTFSEMGVTINVDVIASGRLTSRTSMVDGVQAGTVTCAGSNCDLAASLLTDGGSFPCTITVDFTADKN